MQNSQVMTSYTRPNFDQGPHEDHQGSLEEARVDEQLGLEQSLLFHMHVQENPR